MTNIYVGNLSYDASEQDLENLFAEFGEVASVKLIVNRETGRSKGFGFVEMEDEEAASACIDELHECTFMERQLVVNKARPRRNNNRNNNRY